MAPVWNLAEFNCVNIKTQEWSRISLNSNSQSLGLKESILRFCHGYYLAEVDLITNLFAFGLTIMIPVSTIYQHKKWYYIGIQLARQAFPCFPDIYIQKKISWHTSQLPFDITCESTECQKWDMPPFLSVSFLTLLDFCLFNFSETVWQRLTVTCSELMSCNIFSSGGYVQTFNALRHRNCT